MMAGHNYLIAADLNIAQKHSCQSSVTPLTYASHHHGGCARVCRSHPVRPFASFASFAVKRFLTAKSAKDAKTPSHSLPGHTNLSRAVQKRRLLYNLKFELFPFQLLWPISSRSVPSAMTPPGSRFHASSPSRTTKSPLRCRK